MSVPLEQQLAELARLGIRPGPGVEVEDLLQSFPRDAYEDDPYDLVLHVLGSELEAPPAGRRGSPDVWVLDTERVHGKGAYAGLVRELARLAGREADLFALEDDVDAEAGRAWVGYVLDGRRHRHEAALDADWVDRGVVAQVAEDLSQEGRGFLASQVADHLLVVAGDADRARALTALTGLRFERLGLATSRASRVRAFVRRLRGR